MNCIINGKEYRYIVNSMKNKNDRESYIELVKNVFGLDFTPWYNFGYCNGTFVPHTLYDGEKAIASVGVLFSDFMLNGELIKSAQISTVATDENYRKQGINRYILEKILPELKEKADFIYLYANDSVLEFYPKFGFISCDEYRYSIELSCNDGDWQKLDLKKEKDVDLIVEKYKESNPFSAITMENNIDIIMFHLLMFHSENIYYSHKFKTIAIIEETEEGFFCYDIFSSTEDEEMKVLSNLPKQGKQKIVFGFTPIFASKCKVEKDENDDTTLFVLKAPQNMLKENKLTLPFLSRA